MKKLLFILVMVLGFCLIAINVKATDTEEIEIDKTVVEIPTEEVETEVVEEIKEETTEVVEEVETEEEYLTVEEVKEELSDKLKTWMDDKFENSALTSWVLTIFNAILSTGFLTALLGIAIKYGKYKKGNTDEIIKEVKNQVGEYLKERFDNLSETEIKKLIENIDKLSASNEVIMKVLVLMQDKTSEGKVALLDYLGTKTESQEVKDKAQEEKEKIETELKDKEEKVAKINEENIW